MALNRRFEHGQRSTLNSDSGFSSLKLPEDTIRHLKETTTVDQIFQEVNIRPLTPIQDASKDTQFELSSDEDDDGDFNGKDDSSVADSNSSDSSNSGSSDDSSDDSDSSNAAESVSSIRSLPLESQTGRSSVPTDSLNLDSAHSWHLPLNSNDGGGSVGRIHSTGSALRFKISYDSNSQSPSLPSSTSSAERSNGLLRHPAVPASSKKSIDAHQLQRTVNSEPSPPSLSLVASSGVVLTATDPVTAASGGAASVVNTGAVLAVPPPPKKAPLSPGAMSKLTGIEIKPLPKTNFMKKRATADDLKLPSSKRPKVGKDHKLSSALQRAYSPERVAKKKPMPTQFGEHWDSELDGISQDLEPGDYVVAERLPLDVNPDPSTGKDDESGSDVPQVEEADTNDAATKRTQKRRKNIGDIWGSMVTKADGPTEDIHSRDPWGRHAAPKPRRADFNPRRRDFGRNDESAQSKDSSDRDRGRDRDWERDRDKYRERDRVDRDRDHHRHSKSAMKSACTQTEAESVGERPAKGSEIGVQTSKTVSSNEDLFLESSIVYSDRAYDLKTHADSMPDGLMKLLYYSKSTILLIQETYALEKEQVDIKDISAKLQQLINFSKSYSEIITLQLSQDPERSWAILNVFTLQIQCFLYSRVFSLRRNEVTRARTKLDDLLMELAKSCNPSPTESKGSSTKVILRPPTVPESQSFQFYVKYMEMMNRCYSYTDRAENFIRKSSRVNEFYSKLRHDVGQLHIDSSLSFFLIYCTEVLNRLGFKEN